MSRDGSKKKWVQRNGSKKIQGNTTNDVCYLYLLDMLAETSGWLQSNGSKVTQVIVTTML